MKSRPNTTDYTEARRKHIFDTYNDMAGKHTKAAIARTLNISDPTILRNCMKREWWLSMEKEQEQDI